MIINAQKSNVEIFGDVQEFKTSIDPKNLEFITTLLSSNLYSNPERSFIREIVSNAWDSHVEAGTTNQPVIIVLEESSVTIRDFGTGLSPERFKNIFCNVGSSTKRESNDYIGCFGIGRYSALSCSNTVYINSYYNGIKYQYVMIKDGNSITTNLVLASSTEEKNGLEVCIRNIGSLIPYREALDYTVFFPNLYLQGIESSVFNNIKIKRFKNYAVASISIKAKALLGNVLYPIDWSYLTARNSQFITDIQNTGIVVSFNIGEVDITPNRENIIYTKSTIDKVNQRIEAARKELDENAFGLYQIDCKNLDEWYSLTSSILYYHPIENVVNTLYTDGYKIGKYPSGITYKGKDIRAICSLLVSFLHSRVPAIKAVLSLKRFFSKKFPYRIEDMSLNITKEIICVKGRLTEVVKQYLNSIYEECTIAGEIDVDTFEKYMKQTIFDRFSVPAKDIDYIVGECYEYIINKVKILDTSTDKDFLEFKQSISEEAVKPVMRNIILYECNKYQYRVKHYFETLDDAVRHMKEKKCGIILEKMKEDESWCRCIEARGFLFYKARADVVDAIRDMNLSFIVDREWAETKDPLLVKVATVFNPEIISSHTASYIEEISPTLPKWFKVHAKAFADIYFKFYGKDDYIKLARACGSTDPYMEWVCRKITEYVRAYRDMEMVLSTDNVIGKCNYSVDLIAAAIMKKKIYRINYNIYKAINKNKLYRILCGKL